MPKKFIPDAALLSTILTRYKETNSYAAVSRETGLSAAIIKRIITENTEKSDEEISAPSVKKPQTASQILAQRVKYNYCGPAPIETSLPRKFMFYNQLIQLMKEHLNVQD